MNPEPKPQIKDCFIPTLNGKRFENHTLPLDLVDDLVVLKELLVETAKWQYLKDNPKRKKLPKGYQDDFDLHLVRIDEGSTRPVFGKITNAPELALDDNIARAIETLNLIILAFEKSVQSMIPRDFPARLLRYFDGFGRSLREDESISLRKESPDIRYTRKVRDNILERIKVETWSIKTIRGRITEMDRESNSFHFRSNENRIVGKIQTGFYQKVLETFTAEHKPMALILGNYAKNIDGKLTKLENIQDITTIEVVPIIKRMNYLLEIDAEWLATTTERSRETLVRDFIVLWESHISPRISCPYLFPMDTTGIQMEWKKESQHLTVELDLLTLAGDLFITNSKTDTYSEEKVNLNHEKYWQRINTLAKDY